MFFADNFKLYIRIINDVNVTMLTQSTVPTAQHVIVMMNICA